MKQSRSLSRSAIVRAVMAAVLLALTFVASTVLPVHAVDDGSIGIRPANESDFFHLSLRPGESIDATAIVSNHTSNVVTLLNYPVDAVSDPTGAFAMEGEDSARVGVGAWVQLEASELEVPAASEVEVDFRLTVPPDTPPGDYAGALIIQSPPVPGETTIVDDIAVRLDVVQRQGVRIYLKVEGTALSSLAVGALDWHEEAGALTFTLSLHNSGNTVLHPAATVQLQGWVGDRVELQFDVPESLLPGAQVDVKAHLGDAGAMWIGEAHATVTSEAGREHVTVSVAYGPWLLLGFGALLIAAAVYGALRLIFFVKRARRTLAKASAEGVRVGPAHRSAQRRDSRPPTRTVSNGRSTALRDGYRSSAGP